MLLTSPLSIPSGGGGSPKAPSRFWKMRQRWSRVILIRSCRKGAAGCSRDGPRRAACSPLSAPSSPHTCFARPHQAGWEPWEAQPVAKPLGSSGLVSPFPEKQGFSEQEGIQGNSWFHRNNNAHSISTTLCANHYSRCCIYTNLIRTPSLGENVTLCANHHAAAHTLINLICTHPQEKIPSALHCADF